MLGADHSMQAHRVDSWSMVHRGRSADAAEGVGSFLDKRPARFPDRVSADLPPDDGWWSPRPYTPVRDPDPGT